MDVSPSSLEGSVADQESSISPQPLDGLRILVDIRMSNGMHIQQRNLSYDGLKDLVEKLEALC